MEFRCRLGTPGGEVLEGIYVAEDEARLRREFDEKGLLVLSLRPKAGLQGLSLPFSGRRRIPRQEFLMFNQELATLLKAGMPLVQSLDILRQRVATPTFKGVLDGVYDKVRAGSALSDAFAVHADLFPPVYAASLTAGERSGSLDGVLRRYVSYEKISGAVRRRTISALIYPAILVTLMLGLIGIIVFRVVPAFSDFYATFDRELPLATRVIVGVSSVLAGNLLLVLLVTGAVVATGVTWFKRGDRRRLDRWLLSLPVVGHTLHKFTTAQLARTLSTLLGGGIPLVSAIDIGVQATANRHVAAEMDAVGRRVREGESFAGALRAREVFPDVAIKMVEVGESTGALQEMLSSLADFYDEEIETEVARFITLIEPVLLVIMGVVIALVVVALYLPLFELSAVVG
ncbi:MAG: type II secretion system F family protein [Acidobacteria bacterium]|nr:type II secretion system F family protein [Acidobacteriota bacterium]